MNAFHYAAIAEAVFSADFGPTVLSVTPFVTPTDRRLEMAQRLCSKFERVNTDFAGFRFAFVHMCMTGENRF